MNVNRKNIEISSELSKSIDLIRGLAALGVIYGHSMYNIDLPIEMNGAFWVWVFLPISGYLVASSFLVKRYHSNIHGFFYFILNRL